MKGICSFQCIIESDGSMYPCDFYTFETYKIRNILNNSFDYMYNNTISFLTNSISAIGKCQSCKYYYICRNGCRRHRENQNANLNYFCEPIMNFFVFNKLI